MIILCNEDTNFIIISVIQDILLNYVIYLMVTIQFSNINLTHYLYTKYQTR
jgi:hypothetical protein